MSCFCVIVYIYIYIYIYTRTIMCSKLDTTISYSIKYNTYASMVKTDDIVNESKILFFVYISYDQKPFQGA